MHSYLILTFIIFGHLLTMKYKTKTCFDKPKYQVWDLDYVVLNNDLVFQDN